MTDMDGNFTLDGVKNGDIIQISFIGYATQEIPYAGQASLSVHLEEDTQKLDEVVVTALGMKRDKKALGYAMQELKGDELLSAREPNLANSLSGKVSGLQIVRSSNGVGGSSKIVLRGNSSLTGSNQPLIVVDGTPMDFRTGKPLGRDLDTGFCQTTMAGGGFDHCYVLDRPRGASQSLCAWASSDKTGISMKMYTTQPGIQLYTGNFLQNCPSPGKGGVPLEKYGGFALETQHFPCSPSHPEFPTTVLRAGKVFRANTTLRFFTGRQCGRL